MPTAPIGFMELMAILITAASTSGFAAAWLTRKSRREKDADLMVRVSEADKLTTDAISVAMTSLRNELTAAKADMEKRRGLLATQEALIEAQGKEIRDARRLLDEHATTIRELIQWASRITAELKERGIAHPPLPRVPVLAVRDEDQPST